MILKSTLICICYYALFFFLLTMVFKCRLKALVAIPKVQPRFAVAIWKKYPTMRSLLNAYMDPSKSVST